MKHTRSVPRLKRALFRARAMPRRHDPDCISSQTTHVIRSALPLPSAPLTSQFQRSPDLKRDRHAAAGGLALPGPKRKDPRARAPADVIGGVPSRRYPQWTRWRCLVWDGMKNFILLCAKPSRPAGRFVELELSRETPSASRLIFSAVDVDVLSPFDRSRDSLALVKNALHVPRMVRRQTSASQQ